MTIGSEFADELEQEAAGTRVFLERVPEEKFAWKPHEKSMSMQMLASHLGESFEWGRNILSEPEFRFDPDGYKPWRGSSRDEIIEKFDQTLKDILEIARSSSDEHMLKTWRMFAGEKLLMEAPRIIVVRAMVLKHMIHHRGQFSVYLRLNDIPVPPVYGPTADEDFFPA